MVYIPGYLAKKVYEKGSLKNNDNGFEFSFRNRMTPLRISGMRDFKLVVDGVRHSSENIQLELEGSRIDIQSGDVTGSFSFAKDTNLKIRALGSMLDSGKHVLKISFITNEYGGATLKVSDIVGQQNRIGFFGSVKNKLFGAQSQMPVQPVEVEGELAGIPLDPDFARLEAAINLEEPDRVPLFEAEIALPIQEWFLGREIATAADEVEFYIRAGYDFVPVLPPFFTPRLMRTASGDSDALSEADKERAWLVESEGIIKTIQDVESFPWPKAEEVDFTSFEEIAALLPPKMKILGMLSPAAIFGNTSQSMGLENFSYALMDQPELIETLFEIIGSAYLAITEKLVKMPKLGAVFMSDDLAHTGGLLVSPTIYKKHVFPWYQKIGNVLSNAGLPFLFHSDGRLWDVLDDLADCGVRGIHPVEPQAMDICELKKRYGDRFCIFGNIDLDYTLTNGTPQEVENLVKQRIREMAPGGGYGLAASNSIPDYVKPENYKAMITAARKYGKYPIQL
jgi:uroporphyrinogen decarboxylase